MIKLSLLIGAFLLTACASVTTPTQTALLTKTSSPPSINAQSPSPTNLLQIKMRDLTIQDLSSHIPIDPKTVLVIRAEYTQWPDSSLGCPQAGETYTQATTEGYLIILEANNQTFEYHTNLNDRVILCKVSDLPAFPITPGEIDDGQPWIPVN